MDTEAIKGRTAETQIVMAKRLGFSIDEVKEVTTRELFELLSIMTESNDEPKRVKATQADIDRMFA